MTEMTGKAVPMTDLSGKTALVVGASRGLGRGIALALDRVGALVVAVGRDPAALAGLAATGTGIRVEVADAAREKAAEQLIGRYHPDILVLVAGAVPAELPLHEHTWETFSLHWHADVKIAFSWLKAALLEPLPPGSRVVVISSGAAVFGSPASGGYAGAKATQRFIAAYAAEESRRACRHHRYGRTARDNAVRRRRQGGDPGIRRPYRQDRGRVPRRHGRAVDPRTGRVRAGGPGACRSRQRRARLPADPRRPPRPAPPGTAAATGTHDISLVVRRPRGS